MRDVRLLGFVNIELLIDIRRICLCIEFIEAEIGIKNAKESRRKKCCLLEQKWVFPQLNKS